MDQMSRPLFFCAKMICGAGRGGERADGGAARSAGTASAWLGQHRPRLHLAVWLLLGAGGAGGQQGRAGSPAEGRPGPAAARLRRPLVCGVPKLPLPGSLLGELLRPGLVAALVRGLGRG